MPRLDEALITTVIVNVSSRITAVQEEQRVTVPEQVFRHGDEKTLTGRYTMSFQWLKGL